MLEKTEGAKNEQFRNHGNIGHTRHRTKTSKTKNKHRKLKR
jgi:hypothetical protein